MNTSTSNTDTLPRQRNAIAREFWEAMEDKNYSLADGILAANDDLVSEVLIWPQRPRNCRSLIQLFLNYLIEHLPIDRAARVAVCSRVAKLLSCVLSYPSGGPDGCS